MFTGLVEEVGRITRINKNGDSMRLSIEGKTVLQDIKIGDSIAVNGICLTVTDHQGATFSVDVMPETVYRTSLKTATIGTDVNLERAMAANGRFGGHIVSGHIDGVAKLVAKRELDNAVYFTFKYTSGLQRYLVAKGSITIDGISLTIADLEPAGAADEAEFTVSIIPHTLQATNLGERKIGDLVNIEVDILAKYVESILAGASDQAKGASKLTETYLKEQGF